MKLGASLLFTIASAQNDYDNYNYNVQLDGASVNTATFDGPGADIIIEDVVQDVLSDVLVSNALTIPSGERLRDGKQVEEATGGLDLSMLNSLLSSYGFDYGSNNYDYGYNGADNAADLITTPAPGTLDPNNFLTTIPFEEEGRPGADGADGKTFENFSNDANDSDDDQSTNVVQLRDQNRSNCWVCHGTGADPYQDCIDNGANQSCLDQGDQDYCMITLRRTNGVVTALESRCAQADTCDGLRNFQQPGSGRRNDQCIPDQFLHGRNRYKESVCSICHYPTLAWGMPMPENPAAGDLGISTANNSRMHISTTPGDKYVGIISGAGEYVLNTWDVTWGDQPNNVFDAWANPIE
jgi:hypothetical protein